MTPSSDLTGDSPMDVIEAIHSRRSIRAYTAQPVERDLIEDLIWDAAQAPPPFSGQVPWTFNVILGAARIARYGELAKQYARDHRPEGAAPFWADREDFKVFWDAPAVVVISGGMADCCRAGQVLILSAHARGLGACWVGAPMQWLETPAAKTEVGIPDELTPSSVICLGHAASIPAAPGRGRPTVIWQDDSMA
jgi:nitroreductase